MTPTFEEYVAILSSRVKKRGLRAGYGANIEIIEVVEILKYEKEFD